MKHIIALLLVLLLMFSAIALTGCKKDESTEAPTAASSIPDDLTPIGQNGDGSVTGYSKFEKNEEGQITRDYTYDSLGNLQGSIGHEYDENGFIIKDIRYNAQGDITSQVQYERNEDGLETKRTELDAQGNITFVIVTELGDDGNTYRTKYDADGNVIESE
ncbi:MAG: hypothetical protein IJH07_02060 [Ruminococcus sp.]|nr:hypothetical protein [Ruminococcus sp.]